MSISRNAIRNLMKEVMESETEIQYEGQQISKDAIEVMKQMLEKYCKDLTRKTLNRCSKRLKASDLFETVGINTISDNSPVRRIALENGREK